MMGQQTRAESLFYYFRLEDQIPKDHLLRVIDEQIDLSFVRERVKGLYSATGRPSIDPEVLLRLTSKTIPGKQNSRIGATTSFPNGAG